MVELLEKDNLGWSVQLPHVRRALHFLNSKKLIQAEDLVEWDRTHGKKLFTWDDEQAGEAWRVYQARLFLNTVRLKLDGLRVRAFINIPEDGHGQARGYWRAEDIGKNESARAIIIADLIHRAANLGKEIRFWKLTPKEREAVFAKLKETMAE